MPDVPVGVVRQHFSAVEMATIKLSGSLEVGDTVRFQGLTTDFTKQVSSVQIADHAVQHASPGQDVTVKVGRPVRVDHVVYGVAESGV